MALERKDRVQDTTTTTGTGTVSLGASSDTGFRTFVSAVTNGATVRYLIESADSSEWEVGEGVFTDGTPDTLTRVTVYASSNAGALVNFSAGTKKVHLVLTVADMTQATGAEVNTGTDDVKLVTAKAIADSYLSNVYAGVARQAIINGNFDIWQRGTTFTGMGQTYAADRFGFGYVTSAVIDVLRSTDVPTVAESGTLSNYSFHIDVTTADTSIAAADVLRFGHKIEGNNAKVFGFGKTGTRYVTLSFWVKATKTGIYCVSFRNSASDRSYVSEYTVNVSDTWEKKTITIPVDTTGTWLYDTGVGLFISWTLAAGSNFQTSANAWTAGSYLTTSNQVNALDSTSNNFKIAQVQLCAGSIALPFQPKSFEDELIACQRYYAKSFQYATAPAQAVGSVLGASHQLAPLTTVDTLNYLPVRMRTIPSITVYNPINSDTKWRDTSAGSDIVSGIDQISETKFLLTGSTSVAGRNYYIHWSADAEL